MLDAGCGNGGYVGALRAAGAEVVGCDLSPGMMSGVDEASLVNADVVRLPFRDRAFDAVLAAHMLYHVDERCAALSELARVLDPPGVFVAVTNGSRLMESVRDLVEAAVHRTDHEWVMRSPSVYEFSLENGASQLARVFRSIELVRPPAVGVVTLSDPSVVAEYVASVADIYGPGIGQPWDSVVAYVKEAVADVIRRKGVFVTRGDTGAFVCRR